MFFVGGGGSLLEQISFQSRQIFAGILQQSRFLSAFVTATNRQKWWSLDALQNTYLVKAALLLGLTDCTLPNLCAQY